MATNLRIKFIVQTTQTALLTVACSIAILLSLPRLPLAVPFVSYSIISGSMESSIPTGSVVLVQQNRIAHVGDIAAFYAPDVSGEIIIHRIIGTTQQDGTLFFQTKGDNNNSADTWLVHPSNIIGTVKITIPWIAYFHSKLREPLWFAVLVGIPLFYTSYRCCLLIFDGVKDLKKRKNGKHIASATTALFFCIIFSQIVLPFSPARSLFSTQSTISNISISAAVLTPTPTSTPIPTPTKKPGTVIIISDNGEGSENEVIIENNTQQTVTSTTSTTTQTTIQTESITGGNTVQP